MNIERLRSFEKECIERARDGGLRTSQLEGKAIQMDVSDHIQEFLGEIIRLSSQNDYDSYYEDSWWTHYKASSVKQLRKQFWVEFADYFLVRTNPVFRPELERIMTSGNMEEEIRVLKSRFVCSKVPYDLSKLGSRTAKHNMPRDISILLNLTVSMGVSVAGLEELLNFFAFEPLQPQQHM